MKVAYGIHTGSSSLLAGLNKTEECSRCRFWWLSMVQGDGGGKRVLKATEEGKQWDGAWVLTSDEGMFY